MKIIWRMNVGTHLRATELMQRAEYEDDPTSAAVLQIHEEMKSLPGFPHMVSEDGCKRPLREDDLVEMEVIGNPMSGGGPPVIGRA